MALVVTDKGKKGMIRGSHLVRVWDTVFTAFSTTWGAAPPLRPLPKPWLQEDLD